MNVRASIKILREVLALPTAPFAEQHVVHYIKTFLAARPRLTLRRDTAGNLLVHYRNGKKRVPRPVCLTAHLDHPGFVADKMLTTAKLRANWHGGVALSYFPRGKVRFFTDGKWVRGTVTSMDTVKRNGSAAVKSVLIDVRGPIPQGSPGMWDFPDSVTRNGRIYARACDDLAGAAGMLACIDDLDKRHPVGEAYFLFTRAEEVGFVGAMAACKLGTIPRRCVVIAVENSAERAGARMGDGPILRVGDKTTTFAPAATSFCAVVATDLSRRNKRFRFQRRLMDGGTCESAAFCELGYDATGVCVALGNYHNMNTRSGKLGPEYIDLDDFAHLVAWFIELVVTKRRYTGQNVELRTELDRLQRSYAALLKRSARALA